MVVGIPKTIAPVSRHIQLKGIYAPFYVLFSSSKKGLIYVEQYSLKVDLTFAFCFSVVVGNSMSKLLKSHQLVAKRILRQYFSNINNYIQYTSCFPCLCQHKSMDQMTSLIKLSMYQGEVSIIEKLDEISRNFFLMCSS